MKILASEVVYYFGITGINGHATVPTCVYPKRNIVIVLTEADGAENVRRLMLVGSFPGARRYRHAAARAESW